MPNTFTKTLAIAAALLLSSQAFAEPEAAPAAAEVSIDSSVEVAQTDATTDAAAVEEPASDAVPGWFRMDFDRFGPQFWFGATHGLGGIDIATDIFWGLGVSEFDIGPVLTFGDVTMTPMVGIGFDFTNKQAESLIVPQLFTIWASGDLYIENWIQGFLLSPFNPGGTDDLYVRLFGLYQVSEHVGIGPELELWYALSESGGRKKEITSLPIGGHLNLNYGENNTLGIFLGIETNDNGKACSPGTAEAPPDCDNALAGRFTFIRTW